MSKTSATIKRVIVFLLLAGIVPWLNLAAFSAFCSYFGGDEVLDFYQQNSAQLFRNIKSLSLIAFILTYIIAKQVINKQTNSKARRLLFYILTDIISFFALIILP